MFAVATDKMLIPIEDVFHDQTLCLCNRKTQKWINRLKIHFAHV